MIFELPDVPIRKILLNLSLADFNSVQSVFTSTNNIYLKQLGFQTSVRWSLEWRLSIQDGQQSTGLKGFIWTIL